LFSRTIGYCRKAARRLADAVQRILTKRGVRTLCGLWLSEVGAEGICLDTGEKLAADLVVWTASTRPTPVVKQTFEISPEGRIPVDPYLRPPNSERVYVAGDLAALQDLHGRLYPASAQIAVAQGTRIGQNIIAELAGKLPVEFKPRLLGEALTLGRHAAAAEVGGVLSTGRLAHAMKRARAVQVPGRIRLSRALTRLSLTHRNSRAPCVSML